MKFRMDFITNSSSCSFVICKSDLPEGQRDKIINHIEDNFNHTTIQELMDDIEGCEIEIYNLVEYNPEDEEMHIWVRRDECMDDDFIDDILYEHDRAFNWVTGEGNKSFIEPKFSYHY